VPQTFQSQRKFAKVLNSSKYIRLPSENSCFQFVLGYSQTHR